MSSNNKKKEIDELVRAILESGFSNLEPYKDFSVLQNFTDEELANELSRRTDLGKELE